MFRPSIVIGSLLIGLAFLASAGVSQDKDKKEGTKKEKAKGMLPPGFKDLDLTAAQKASVYTIQSEYRGKIADLEKQIKNLKNLEQKDVFAVLTDDQRAKYFKSKGIDVPAKDKAPEKKDVDKK